MNAAPPKLELDELMARIRVNIAPRASEPNFRPAENMPDPRGNNDQEPPRALTAPQLFALPEAEFIRASYLTFLGREARRDEFVRQRDRLLTWQASRLRIVRELRASPEGRHHDGHVQGLWKVLAWDRAYWSPPAKAGRSVKRAIEFVLGLAKRLETIEHAAAGTSAAIARIQTDQGTDRRAALNQARHLQERISAIREMSESWRGALVARAEAIERRTAQLGGTLSEQANAIERLSAEIQNEIRTVLVDHWRAIAEQKLRTQALLEGAQPEVNLTVEGSVAKKIGIEKEHLLDALYLSFEDRFRGTRADVKERQRVYIPALESCVAATGDGPVIDVGSGRGEWLELLSESGIAAQGFDLNRIAVDECRGRGLDATLGDGLQALKRQPYASLSAITSFHVIEHLPFDALVSMLDNALRALRPGGILILETPNPANLLVAAERFYFDPTHRNPLPSELISYLIKARGFERTEIVPLHPVDWPARRPHEDPMLEFLQDKLFGPQDYGVIGWKAVT